MITRLPKYVQAFKRKKVAQTAKQTWKPWGPKPIDSRTTSNSYNFSGDPNADGPPVPDNTGTILPTSNARSPSAKSSGFQQPSQTSTISAQLSPTTQAVSVPPAIQVICSPGGPVQVIVKKVDFVQNKPQKPSPQTQLPQTPTSVPVSLQPPDTTPCLDLNSQCDIPLPQLTKFMQTATAGGFSEIKYLFPKFNLDRKVLFGDNFNYRFPTTPQFSVQSLISHFVCTKVMPLELAIIVPADFVASPTDYSTCYAITINDLPFQARVVQLNVLRDTVYAAFNK